MGSVISKILDEEREYRPLFKPVNKESVIKWQTGIGSYIITTDEGTIALASFYPDNSSDVEFFRICVTAWCKLSDIEPYKV